MGHRCERAVAGRAAASAAAPEIAGTPSPCHAGFCVFAPKLALTGKDTKRGHHEICKKKKNCHNDTYYISICGPK